MSGSPLVVFGVCCVIFNYESGTLGVGLGPIYAGVGV